MAKINFKKIWSKVKPVIAGIAPAAAAALGGPYGIVAATAIKAALGASSDQEAIDIIMSQDPTELAKLKIAEETIENQRIEMGISREAMYLADVQSARERHKEVKDLEPARLTYLAIILTVAVVTVIVIWSSEMDSFTKNMLSLVVGNLLAKAEKGYNFFLGTSMGSKVKGQQQGKQLEQVMHYLEESNGS